MTAIVVVSHAIPGQVTAAVNGRVIGTSRHTDYFEYHFKRKDLKGLKDAEVGKFVHIDADGKVLTNGVYEAEKLGGRGPKQSHNQTLTAEERAEIRKARSLIDAAIASSKTEAVAKDGSKDAGAADAKDSKTADANG